MDNAENIKQAVEQVSEADYKISKLSQELDHTTKQRDALLARIYLFEQKINDQYHHTNYQSVRLYRDDLLVTLRS